MKVADFGRIPAPSFLLLLREGGESSVVFLEDLLLVPLSFLEAPPFLRLLNDANLSVNNEKIVKQAKGLSQKLCLTSPNNNVL